MNIKKRLKGPEVDWSSIEFGSKERRGITVEKMKDLMKQIPLLHSEEAREFIFSMIDLPNRDTIDDVDSVDDFEELEHD